MFTERGGGRNLRVFFSHLNQMLFTCGDRREHWNFIRFAVACQSEREETEEEKNSARFEKRKNKLA
jgi:hypothetical protein